MPRMNLCTEVLLLASATARAVLSVGAVGAILLVGAFWSGPTRWWYRYWSAPVFTRMTAEASSG